jgi:DNA-directed RNA polymerase subunit RPC12/RpoP
MVEGAWECNECGSHEFSGAVSEEDIEDEQLSCTSCGGREFHWAHEATFIAANLGERMKTIWKYELEITDGPQKIDTFAGSNVRYCAMQNGRLCLWIEVDPLQPHETRVFYVIGTGHPVSEGRYHVESVQQPPFVWHIYEE